MKKLLNKLNVMELDSVKFTRLAILGAIAIGAVRAVGYLIRSVKL